MLVLEGQAVRLVFVGILALGFVVLDHGAAAAGIAGDAVHGHGKIGRNEPGLDQRPQRRDAALRPASGIGDAPRLRNPIRLAARHLGKAIGPALGNPVR